MRWRYVFMHKNSVFLEYWRKKVWNEQLYTYSRKFCFMYLKANIEKKKTNAFCVTRVFPSRTPFTKAVMCSSCAKHCWFWLLYKPRSKGNFKTILLTLYMCHKSFKIVWWDGLIHDRLSFHCIFWLQ